jgi:hypothetical protein
MKLVWNVEELEHHWLDKTLETCTRENPIFNWVVVGKQRSAASARAKQPTSLISEDEPNLKFLEPKWEHSFWEL